MSDTGSWTTSSFMSMVLGSTVSVEVALPTSVVLMLVSVGRLASGQRVHFDQPSRPCRALVGPLVRVGQARRSGSSGHFERALGSVVLEFSGHQAVHLAVNADAGLRRGHYEVRRQ